MTVAFKTESNDVDMEDVRQNVSQIALPVPPSSDAVMEQLRYLVSSDNLNLEPTIVKIRAASLIARLKALNRNATHATRQWKQATAEARQEMDHAHLGLQNLQFEKRHLEREIEKCRQFGSIYQDIPLYTLEEFQQLAPQEARTEDVLSSEHQLMLNRLSFELAERQRLDQRRKELLQQKEELLKQGKAKGATLDNVKSQIDLLLKTAKDVQKKVDDLVQPTPAQAGTKVAG